MTFKLDLMQLDGERGGVPRGEGHVRSRYRLRSDSQICALIGERRSVEGVVSHDMNFEL